MKEPDKEHLNIISHRKATLFLQSQPCLQEKLQPQVQQLTVVVRALIVIPLLFWTIHLRYESKFPDCEANRCMQIDASIRSIDPVVWRIDGDAVLLQDRMKVSANFLLCVEMTEGQ